MHKLLDGHAIVPFWGGWYWEEGRRIHRAALRVPLCLGGRFRPHQNAANSIGCPPPSALLQPGAQLLPRAPSKPASMPTCMPAC
eukprot:357323-Chlamydomonas_euryale.AAC.2